MPAPILKLGLDGVMIGRAAYHTPYEILSRVDSDVFRSSKGPAPEAQSIAEQMIPYMEAHLQQGGRFASDHAAYVWLVCRAARRAALAKTPVRAGCAARCSDRRLSAFVKRTRRPVAASSRIGSQLMDIPTLLPVLASLIAIGGFAGFLAGLLGVGGGIVLVSAFFVCLSILRI